MEDDRRRRSGVGDHDALLLDLGEAPGVSSLVDLIDCIGHLADGD